MPNTERPLGKITAILSELGLEVTYAYDDLVFVQHSAFLLQFTDNPTILKIFANATCTPAEAEGETGRITDAYAIAGFSAVPSGTFTLSQNDDETIHLEFD